MTPLARSTLRGVASHRPIVHLFVRRHQRKWQSREYERLGRMKSIRRTVASLLVAISLLVSCTIDVDETTDVRDSSSTQGRASTALREYRVPEKFENSTVVWSAEPGIDLLSPEATVVRAVIEARQIALATSLSERYPGFGYAIDESARDFYEEVPSDSHLEYGTAYHRITRLDRIENGFVAYACLQLSNIAGLNADGLFERSISQAFLTSPLAIERSDPSIDPSLPPAPTGPSSEANPPQWQAPTFDAFAGWDVRFNGPRDISQAAVCTDWGRQFAPDAPEEGSLRVSSEAPPETLPANPGW
ncbi:MAG: hypothetical protein WAX14_07905 [Rhodococcus sp. (in: high G+C Gram-positive bacteria)]|uniref:hypothetical protein n=1 Tax=Rhodococcus sp. TaxID=1831 RepID=UPI003BB735C8